MSSWSLVFALIVALLAGLSPVRAGDGESACEAWAAAVQEREEGAALTATACAKTDTHDAVLEVVCFGEKVNIRYIHAPDRGADEFGPKRDFAFITNKGRRTVFMTFEAIDGAFTAYLDKEHPLFALLMEARTLSVEDPTRRLKSRKITLANSRDAISAVIDRCREGAAATAPCPEAAPAAAQTRTEAQTEALHLPAPLEGGAARTGPASAGGPAGPGAGGEGAVSGRAGDATPRTSGATGQSGDRR